jgi:diguanylate cyclase (GGDEF)-like protein
VATVVRRIRTGEDARHAITTAALELTGANSACIIEPLTNDSLVVTGSAGLALSGTVIPLDSLSHTATVFRSGEPLFLPDVLSDPRMSPALLELTEATSALWQPVIAEGVVTGVLTVTWPDRVACLNHRVIGAIELLAHETAVALQHDQLLGRLAELANTDTLTGVGNRRSWDDRLGQLMAQARRSGAPLTVAFLDLDHFKVFNDRHGHLRGDALLSTTARRFQAQLREADVLARWGGEEFAVALPGCDGVAAAPMLERLRAAVTHRQTCSVGYATWDGFETPEQLLARADAALYDAKSTGRDRSVAALLPSPRRPPVERLTSSDPRW